MKKKLAILVFAGVMLFSGLNVYAASSNCTHSYTYYFYVDDMYIANLTQCNEHDNCQVGDAFRTKVVQCYFCRITLDSRIVNVGRKHITQ